MNDAKDKTVIIGSIDSDIGKILSNMFKLNGWNVIGTTRHSKSHKSIRYLELLDKISIDCFSDYLQNSNIKWDLYISCFGNPLPLKKFTECDFDEWNESIQINSISQLRLLHSIYKFRNKNSTVVFFAGNGVNDAPIYYSAYVSSKIFLIKMCEMIDAENDDIKIASIGPGWVYTKTHNKILENGEEDKLYYKQTKMFLHDSSSGTSIKNIFKYIMWIYKCNKNIVSGRNFSVKNDIISNVLESKLHEDDDMYKLRRHRNDQSR
jgi:short-subunit dehydrogenase